jgi:pantothenate synthetase
MSVNRYLDDETFDDMDHALGRPVDPLADTYRNRYIAAIDSKQAQHMAASAHWLDHGIQHGYHCFSVSDAGRAALRDHLLERVG